MDDESLNKFRKSHTKREIISLHIFSLFLIIFGGLILLSNIKYKNEIILLFIIVQCFLSIKLSIVLLLVILLLDKVVKLSKVSNYSVLIPIMIIIIGYLITDVSHLYYRVKPYKSEYSNSITFTKDKFIHNIFLY